MLTSPGMVEDVEPRKSELGDPAVANVDNVLVVFSLLDPPWDGQMATRFLVCAERAQIPVCNVNNKADMASPDQVAHAVAEVLTPQASVGAGTSAPSFYSLRASCNAKAEVQLRCRINARRKVLLQIVCRLQ